MTMKNYPTITLVVDLRVEVEVPKELGPTMNLSTLQRSLEGAMMHNPRGGVDTVKVEVLQYFGR